MIPREMIQITFNGKDDLVFHPGNILEGVVKVMPDVEIPNVRKFEVKVGWTTQGKGNVEQKTIHSWVQDDIVSIKANVPILQDFAVTLPDSPLSFKGHYIHIIWSVDVHIEVHQRNNLHLSQRFILQRRE